jgi:hypothetical protein
LRSKTAGVWVKYWCTAKARSVEGEGLVGSPAAASSWTTILCTWRAVISGTNDRNTWLVAKGRAAVLVAARTVSWYAEVSASEF